jgi:RimJ/RimL family protein N-acetyltransferase
MTSENWLQEITLRGETVTLIPLRPEHAQGLIDVAADGELWNLWYTFVPKPGNVEGYIATAQQEQRAGVSLPFAVLLNATQQIVGTTRFCRADNQHHRVEIGFTWYAKTVQKTAVNTECKYLLLQHAFEQLNAIAVEFRTHWHNHPSRAAIARLGAKQDGVLRNMQKDADGSYRDTVIFSIIDGEWPTVKKSLRYKMIQYSR